MKLLVTGASGFIGHNVLLRAPREWDIVAVYNSTLSGNSAALGGGVFSKIGSSTTLDHVTIAFNNAESTGGGVGSSNVATANRVWPKPVSAAATVPAHRPAVQPRYSITR